MTTLAGYTRCGGLRQPLLVQHPGAFLAGHQGLKPSRGGLRSQTRVGAYHKDIQDIVYSADAIRERIKVMGRCACQAAPEQLLHA